MGSCQVIFICRDGDIIIKCKRNELMRNIIIRYGKKSGLKINKFNFFYNGHKINMDLTLSEIMNKDKEIFIIVSPKGTNNSASEVTLKVEVGEEEVNQPIYFLDNTTQNNYLDDGKSVKHYHDNLKELNERSTSLFIEGKKVPFKKLFIPKKSGKYSIKLIFKYKLRKCAFMFCECKNIINIDFSKFNTDDVEDMKYMFSECSRLKSLNLSSFNTQNVNKMECMFNRCTSLTALNLLSFNTQNVMDMFCMFKGCSSLTTLNLSSFNTQNVNNMESMFNGCSSLTTLNLSSFNTQNVDYMDNMFNECINLSICGSSDEKILREYKNKD